MLGINMRNVDAAGGNRPGAGGYVIQIMRVMDNPSKERLEIEYEIAEGEYRGYYTDLKERRGFWGGKLIRSYKPKALPFLKQFIQMIQECNDGAPGLVVGDYEGIEESKLPGCKIGIVYGMEEYVGNDGKVKQRPDTFGAEFMSLDRIRSGDYEVPDLKPLEGALAAAQSGGVVDTTAQMPDGFQKIDDDKLPF